jgi:hypothetical protein
MPWTSQTYTTTMSTPTTATTTANYHLILLCCYDIIPTTLCNLWQYVACRGYLESYSTTYPIRGNIYHHQYHHHHHAWYCHIQANRTLVSLNARDLINNEVDTEVLHITAITTTMCNTTTTNTTGESGVECEWYGVKWSYVYYSYSCATSLVLRAVKRWLNHSRSSQFGCYRFSLWQLNIYTVVIPV